MPKCSSTEFCDNTEIIRLGISIVPLSIDTCRYLRYLRSGMGLWLIYYFTGTAQFQAKSHK